MRETVILSCQECGRRNYTTTKNRRLHPERVEYKKYCPFDKKHTVHKQTR
jgi:large subunit ribosomal protein L33